MASKPAAQINTGDRIRYAGRTYKIVGEYGRKGLGTGVMPSPYQRDRGTGSELVSRAQDVATRGRCDLGFARDAVVELDA